MHGSFAVAAEAYDIGDNHAVNGIVLGFADVHAAQRIGLNGIDDVNGKPIVAQMREQSQPIVTSGFHAEDDGLVQAANHVHELVVARLRVGEAQSLADEAAILGDDRGFVEALGNIDTDDKHENHLEKMLRTALFAMRVITYCEMRRRQSCRDIRLITEIPQGQRLHSC